jgi:hypothetical protein
VIDSEYFEEFVNVPFPAPFFQLELLSGADLNEEA